MPAKRKSESRSLTARGAATRSRVVNAAADLIYEHGVDRTSLDEVMAASSVSKSQLYHYFADKDALVLEVIALQAERALAAQRPHLGALDSLRALRAWGQAIIRLNEQVHMGGWCQRKFPPSRDLRSLWPVVGDAYFPSPSSPK